MKNGSSTIENVEGEVIFSTFKSTFFNCPRWVRTRTVLLGSDGTNSSNNSNKIFTRGTIVILNFISVLESGVNIICTVLFLCWHKSRGPEKINRRIVFNFHCAFCYFGFHFDLFWLILRIFRSIVSLNDLFLCTKEWVTLYFSFRVLQLPLIFLLFSLFLD